VAWLLRRELNLRSPLGTYHYQGFLQLYAKAGRHQARSLLGGRAHLEERRGSAQQAIDYCLKDDTRADGPWRFGEPVLGRGHTGGRQSALSRVLEVVRAGGSLEEAAAVDPAAYVRVYRGVQHLQELLAPPPVWRAVRCFFLEGPSGCGKSSLVYDSFAPADVYSLAKQAPLWFNGYRGQRVLFIDEYQGLIAREELLLILDGHRYAAEYKGGFASAGWDCVVLASNYPFQLWHDAAVRRRFERGGYFRLSGGRGQYAGLQQRLRGVGGGVVDDCVTQVSAVLPAAPIGQAWNYMPIRV